MGRAFPSPMPDQAENSPTLSFGYVRIILLGYGCQLKRTLRGPKMWGKCGGLGACAGLGAYAGLGDCAGLGACGSLSGLVRAVLVRAVLVAAALHPPPGNYPRLGLRILRHRRLTIKTHQQIGLTELLH